VSTNDLDPGLRSRQLGARLRAALETAGITSNRAAQILGLSQPSVSRMLTGKREHNPLRVALLLGLCQVPAAERKEILGLLGPETGEDSEYWVLPHPGGPPEESSTVRFACATAAGIEWCAPAGLPVLAQTAESMRAELRRRGVADVDRWTAARDQQRDVLFHPVGPTLHAFVHESSLLSLPGDEQVRQAQFIRLAMLIGQRRLRPRVVPAERERALMGGEFAVLRFRGHPPAVLVPGETVTLVLEGDHHVAGYRRRLDTLDALALSDKDSDRLIMKLAN
jgi:transcriptional regulator with XRE-family HTH domain